MKEQLQNYCDKLNEILSMERDYDTRYIQFYDTIDEMVEKLPETSLYWNRAVYIANGFDFGKVRHNVIQKSEDYICELSDDMDEHPGVVVRFKNMEEEW